MGKASSLWTSEDILEVKYSRDEFEDDDERDDDSSSSSSSRDDDDDDDDFDDDRSSSDDDDEYVMIDGIAVKVRGDGSFDDSQPSGVRFTNAGLKLRGDGSIDDSQSNGVRIVGTRRKDKLIGTGLFAESVAGRRGNDDFICGNRRGSFYLDGRGERETYMSIEDFDRGDNTVVCSGSRSDYKIAMTRVGGERGVGIFFKENRGKDLVAFLEEVNKRQFRPSDDMGFFG